MNRPLESDLHALVDGHLDAARAAEVAAWLAANPEDAARVHAWKAQKEALHAAFDGLLEQAPPARLQRAAIAPPWHRRLLPMAAVVAWIALGATIGFFARSAVTPAPRADLAASLPRQAAIAHTVYSPEVKHPVEVGAEQEAHLTQWLSKRLGSPLAIPHLNGQGFDLVGGRLLPGDKGPVAQFMYQDKAGLRLTLYVRRDAGNAETAFRFASEGAVSVFYWIDGPFGYALSGELPRDRLLTLADATYRQMGSH